MLLLYTRFINLGWGLPYPFHPDERNMADAIVRLQCTGFNIDCLNPHFFAYGQFPLYIGYALIILFHMAAHITAPIIFTEAVMSLRVISVAASMVTVWFSYKLIRLLTEKFPDQDVLSSIGTLFFILSPALIQFAHFGTTESLLMCFYTLIIYHSTTLLMNKTTIKKYFFWVGLICGLALATKISALIFIIIPVLVIIYTVLRSKEEQKLVTAFFYLSRLGVYTALIAIFFSPHNFISFSDFLGSMQYESSVGIGKMAVFYTRQFALTIPVEFQIRSIFPYALGWPVWILFILSFFLLPYKKEYNLLRLAFLIGLLPNAFVFTKWTRFVSLVFPLMILMSFMFSVFLYKEIYQRVHTLKKSKLYVLSIKSLLMLILFISILPGIAFLSVYRNEDVRFTASEWIYNNVPNGSVILSETANVVDLPIPNPYEIENHIYPDKSYTVIPFNSYDLDSNPDLVTQLQDDINRADYILVPSRRVFANHTCLNNTTTSPLLQKTRCQYLEETYPQLNEYYKKLFNGELGFTLVKEFSSYPTISLFGKQILTLPDEMAEETWTVFDHPVIRIYKNKKYVQSKSSNSSSL
jgi:hypothetical protein